MAAARTSTARDTLKDPKRFLPALSIAGAAGLGAKKALDKRKKSKQPTAAPKVAKAATTQNTSNYS
jgi:hypothetical protein|tara:strand:- start:4383 stop:4580 length:198 start_codon:yes stop_codon:yes gene_type:complete